MPSSYFKPLSLMFLAAVLCGCGGPGRIHPPGIDAEAAGPAAIQEYDANGDGAIAGEELAKAGSIRQALQRIDGAVEGSSPDQKVTAEEITARINQWKESRVGRMAMQCTVRYRGMPLQGATVRFVPEKFLGENVKTAVGETDRNGTAVLSVPDVSPPGVAPGLYKVEITKQGANVPPQYNTQTILGQEVANDAIGMETGIIFNLQKGTMRNLDELFAALAKSTFRSRFRLGAKERSYLETRTLPVILEHGRQFVLDRLAPAEPKNDGRQTPMRGHPVFIAQHATATCCRGCLAKWHRIASGKPLDSDEVEYVISVIERWIETTPGSRDSSRNTQPPSQKSTS